MLANAVRLYAERAAEHDGALPAFAPDAATATEVMVTVTAMLKAVNLQVFELGMWQAWSGGVEMDLPLSDFRHMAVEEFDTTTLLAHAAQQAQRAPLRGFPDRRRRLASLRERSRSHEILEYIEDPVHRSRRAAQGMRAGGGITRPTASAIRTWAAASPATPRAARRRRRPARIATSR